jgi:hypothetical protein
MFYAFKIPRLGAHIYLNTIEQLNYFIFLYFCSYLYYIFILFYIILWVLFSYVFGEG